MSIKLRQIQGLNTTLEELNKLQGLAANAASINVLDGYTGSTSDLNDAINLRNDFNSHASGDINQHTIPAGSIDGLAIADSTLPESKLSFDVATQPELDAVQIQVNDVVSVNNSQQSQIDNLYDIVIPDQGQDIAEAVNQAVEHIDNPKDAHDATAISYGEVESGYYPIQSDVNSGDTTVFVGISRTRYFRENDSVKISSDVSPEWNVDIDVDGVNYDTGVITLSGAAPSSFDTANNARIWNLNEDNSQEGIDRALKNNTDEFTGRLTITQLAGRDSLFFTNEANFQSGEGYNLDLGTGYQRFDVDDENQVSVFGVDSNGDAHTNTLALRDYNNNFDGLITKEPLSSDQEWMFPDRSGWIAIGDITFQDLLRVTADTTLGELSVAPGVLPNVIGEDVRAWINMAKGSEFAGDTINVQAQLTSDSKLTGLGSDYMAFIVYLTFTDDLFFWYSSSAQATEQDAIADIPPYLPTAYMKLALVTVQGNGSGGIDTSTLKIHEDLRPLLGQGMSNAHYDESSYFSSVLAAGSVVTVPNNSRAGGQQQMYTIGSGELEIYVNDTFREPGRDYIELSGGPPGQIVFNYDLPADSVVRFRMSWGAAVSIHGGGSGGGGGSGTLQDAYSAGANIFITPGTPVAITSSTGLALNISGNQRLAGVLEDTFALELADQSSEPGDISSTSNKVYADSSGDLRYKHLQNSKTYNITEDLDIALQQSFITRLNNTGLTIPVGATIALHPTIPGQIINADVSSNTKDAYIIGVATENIATGNSGRIITDGFAPGLGSSFSHRDVLYADPSTPGGVVAQSSLVLASGNMAVKLGIVEGNDLLVRINSEGEA